MKCQGHLDYHREWLAANYQKRVEAGKCAYAACSVKPTDGYRMCEAHREKHRGMRARRLAKQSASAVQILKRIAQGKPAKRAA